MFFFQHIPALVVNMVETRAKWSGSLWRLYFCIGCLKEVLNVFITFHVSRNLCYLCSQCLIKVYPDYHDTYLPREQEVTASCELGAFEAYTQKRQKLNINIGVTDKERCG